MAVQTIKKGQLLTIPATEDELILLGPFNPFNQEVRFTNVSGTSKFGIGGPVVSDTAYVGYTTAGTVVRLSLDFVAQANTDNTLATVNRVHCSGVGTWKVEW